MRTALAIALVGLAACHSVHADDASETSDARTYRWVFLDTGSDPPSLTNEEINEMQRLHRENLTRLAKEGLNLLAGPLEGAAPIRGIVVIDVADEAELDQRLPQLQAELDLVLQREVQLQGRDLAAVEKVLTDGDGRAGGAHASWKPLRGRLSTRGPPELRPCRRSGSEPFRRPRGTRGRLSGGPESVDHLSHAGPARQNGWSGLLRPWITVLQVNHIPAEPHEEPLHGPAYPFRRS